MDEREADRSTPPKPIRLRIKRCISENLKTSCESNISHGDTPRPLVDLAHTLSGVFNLKIMGCDLENWPSNSFRREVTDIQFEKTEFVETFSGVKEWLTVLKLWVSIENLVTPSYASRLELVKYFSLLISTAAMWILWKGLRRTTPIGLLVLDTTDSPASRRRALCSSNADKSKGYL